MLIFKFSFDNGRWLKHVLHEDISNKHRSFEALYLTSLHLIRKILTKALDYKII